MGIQGLAKLIADVCPQAIKECDFKSFFGRRIAVDASMSIYQFLIAIRNNNSMMTNDAGETTSHLVGLFYRTCKLLEAGIKPVYVFDGKAPVLKAGELEKRKERRKEAEQKLEEAKETATDQEIGKFSKRLVRVNAKHNDDCRKLLKLMGIPILTAPSEAEAQCAELAKEGLVYAVATEDMDGLTFGAPRVVRHLSAGHFDKVKEFNLEKVLEGLELTHDQFIDLCILMGCDYCDSIRGIGGKKGLELVKEYGSIEEILRKKFNIHEFIDPEISYKEKIKPAEESKETGDDKKDEKDEKDEKKVKEEKKEKELIMSEEEIENLEQREIKSEKDSEHESDTDSPRKENGKDAKCETRDSGGSFSGSEVSDHDQDGLENKNGVAKKKKSKDGKKSKPAVAVPEEFLFRGARKLFQEPNVLKNELTEKDLKIQDIDEEGLIDFLVQENGFSEERVRAGIRRVKESKGKCTQTRIDSFFKPKTTESSTKKAQSSSPAKRSAQGKASASKRGRRPR